METKELKIQIPEGYEIDRENSIFEKIVFKKKENTKPRSWEEYCKLKKENLEHGYMIDDVDTHIKEVEWKYSTTQNASRWRNVLLSKELAEAFLAMMQLMSLRQAWIGDWEPDWKNRNEIKYNLCRSENIIKVYGFWIAHRALSFPTEEMATDFMNTFKDLLEVAKPLI